MPADRMPTPRAGLQRADDRGGVTLLASLVVAALVAVTALLVLAGVVRATGERVRGAADLAALAGAQALASAQDACTAVQQSAEANAVEVTSCRVVGDAVEYVVSVDVRTTVRVLGVEYPLAARAHAGQRTGAPEDDP